MSWKDTLKKAGQVAQDASNKAVDVGVNVGKNQAKKMANKVTQVDADDGDTTKDIKENINDAKKLRKKLKKANKLAKKSAKRAKELLKKSVGFIKKMLALGPVGWLILFFLASLVISASTQAKDKKIQGLLSNPNENANKLAPGVVEGRNGKATTNDKLSGAGSNVNNGGLSNNEKVSLLLIDCKDDKSDNNKKSSDTSSGGASDADWTKEGSTAYKNAKDAFDLWTSKGLSGEAAAGIVGWTVSEGGWYIVGRAEGHYSNILEESSIKFGNVPTVGAGYPTGKTGKPEGGGGIYQFTPYSKYADLSSPDWEDASKINQFVVDAIKNGDWISSHDLTGGNHSFKDFAQSTNAEEATLMFNAYERGAPGAINKDRKRADARRANEIFNKDNIKFDESKFDATFGGGTSSGNDTKKQATGKQVRCKSKNKKSGGSGWIAHMTGKVNYNDGTPWRREDLPDDLKPYALDPESVGLKWGDSSSWELLCYSYGQCTDFSANMMYHLWEKDGKGPANTRGDGYQVVDFWVSKFGGSSSSEPRAGSVFSTSAAEQHTGVVSHVFENGDILIVEQNVKGGYSGDDSGMRRSWSYRYITKSHYSSWKFYDPEQVGYKIKDSAKALA